MVGVTVRVTKPSRSSPRKVVVSIFCEMPPMRCLSSLKRIEPSPRSFTTSTLHLSPTRERISLTPRQPEGRLASLDFIDVPPVSRTSLLPPSFAVTHIVRVTIVYHARSHVRNRGDRSPFEAR